MNNALSSTFIMFKNKKSKEFCQQIDQNDVIIHKKARACKASDKNQTGKTSIFLAICGYSGQKCY